MAVLYFKLTLLGIHSQVFNRGTAECNCHYIVMEAKKSPRVRIRTYFSIRPSRTDFQTV